MNDLKQLRAQVQHLKMLIVDDEGEVLDSTMKFMSKFFKDVFPATHGRMALDLLQSQKFDVLLSDAQMPKMNGYELAEKAREMYPDIFIGIISGTDLENEPDQNIIDIYLRKPLNLETIVDLMKKVQVKKTKSL